MSDFEWAKQAQLVREDEDQALQRAAMQDDVLHFIHLEPSSFGEQVESRQCRGLNPRY